MTSLTKETKMRLTFCSRIFALFGRQYMPRDDEPMNLAGPFSDGHQAGVAVNPLDRIFTRVPVPAVDLDGVAANTFCHFGGEHFRHGGFLVVVPALFF